MKAAKYTLNFRNERNLDERDLRGFVPHGPQNVFEPASKRFIWSGIREDALSIVVPDPLRSVRISMEQGSGYNQVDLVKNVDEEDWLPAHIFFSEWSCHWPDYATRIRGGWQNPFKSLTALEWS